MSSQIRVAILDDHLSIIDGYRFRLEKDAKLSVVGIGTYGEDLDDIFSNHEVDVLILDINVPTSKENSNPYPILHSIPKMLHHHLGLKILVISMYHQATLVKSVIDAGASGYILKDDRQAIQELASIVKTIAQGGMHFSRQAHEQLFKKFANHQGLTPRQLDVISLCAAYPEKTTGDIAKELGVANSTVRNLLSDTYQRLGVHSRVSAVTKARQLGIISPEVPG